MEILNKGRDVKIDDIEENTDVDKKNLSEENTDENLEDLDEKLADDQKKDENTSEDKNDGSDL